MLLKYSGSRKSGTAEWVWWGNVPGTYPSHVRCIYLNRRLSARIPIACIPRLTAYITWVPVLNKPTIDLQHNACSDLYGETASTSVDPVPRRYFGIDRRLLYKKGKLLWVLRKLQNALDALRSTTSTYRRLRYSDVRSMLTVSRHSTCLGSIKAWPDALVLPKQSVKVLWSQNSTK